MGEEREEVVVVCEASSEINLFNECVMGYKPYLFVSLISLVALVIIVATKIDFRNKGILIGAFVGFGFRSLYEFLKEEKQTSEKE